MIKEHIIIVHSAIKKANIVQPKELFSLNFIRIPNLISMTIQEVE